MRKLTDYDVILLINGIPVAPSSKSSNNIAACRKRLD
jgi:hypothetical protein